jgi:heptosyltransferase I
MTLNPPPERILVIRTSALGDVVRGAAALASLRRAFPAARIDWLVDPSFADAIRHHPALSGVVPFPKTDLVQRLRRGNLRSVARWARETLAHPHYDLVIDLQGLLRTGVVALATHCARRVGFADAREGAPFFYSKRVPVQGGRGRHHLERNFELLKAIGVEPVPDLRVFAGNAAQAAFRADADVCHARYILLAPTTKGQGRAWPMDRFAALRDHLLIHRARLGIDGVVVTGMASEREACRPLLATSASTNTGLIDRVGKTDLAGLMALIEHAALVICNDSAALHLAVAYSRPLVALFGPTDVAHAGPWQRPGTVISHKAPGEHVRHRDVNAASVFMERISVAEVIAKCEEGAMGSGHWAPGTGQAPR